MLFQHLVKFVLVLFLHVIKLGFVFSQRIIKLRLVLFLRIIKLGLVLCLLIIELRLVLFVRIFKLRLILLLCIVKLRLEGCLLILGLLISRQGNGVLLLCLSVFRFQIMLFFLRLGELICEAFRSLLRLFMRLL